MIKYVKKSMTHSVSSRLGGVSSLSCLLREHHAERCIATIHSLFVVSVLFDICRLHRTIDHRGAAAAAPPSASSPTILSFFHHDGSGKQRQARPTKPTAIHLDHPLSRLALLSDERSCTMYLDFRPPPPIPIKYLTPSRPKLLSALFMRHS